MIGSDLNTYMSAMLTSRVDLGLLKVLLIEVGLVRFHLVQNVFEADHSVARNRRIIVAVPATGPPLAHPANPVAPAGAARKKEVQVLKRSSLIVLLLMVAFLAVPSFAAPMPSKTVANSSIATRAADLALVRDVVANEQVAKALASHGLTQEQVNSKVAQLSNQDLHQLAQNLNQLNAAGLTRQEWIYILIGAVVVLIIIVAAS